MITYGHEKFIAQAIDGVLMQETNFPVELIIANDHSPDGTDGLIQNYINNHPKGNLIRYFHHEQNIGMMPNFIFALNQTRGKYIALCEGDDYWTDSLKLQKEVDFLEKNKEYSMVCHDALVINEMTNTSSMFFGISKRKQVCSTKDTLNIHFCPTASIVFRRDAILPLSNLDASAAAGDHLLVQLVSLKGLIYRMFDVMSVYRKTAEGVSETNKMNLVESLKNRISTLNHLNLVSNYKYQKNVKIENLIIRNRINLLVSPSKFRTIMLKIKRKALSHIKRLL